MIQTPTIRLLTAAALATTSLVALTSPANAQDAPGAAATATASADQSAADVTNGDIIVTAQRRKERVTTVPISITVANQAQLERQQVNTINDLSRISPSLEINSAPGQNTGGGGSIRGVGTQTFSAGATPSVGVVVDQVSQGNANIADLFDVARIEVLKGPQGTLFGLTTSAGVINISTNAPDPSAFSARIRSELSNAGTAGSEYGNQIVQGVVNIPVDANSALRISGLANLRQGPNRNLTQGGYNDSNRYGIRGRFLWSPTDALSVNVIGDYTRSTVDYGGDFFTFVKATPADTQAIASCGITPGVGNKDICTTLNPRATTENYGGSLQVDYQAEPFTITSISAFRRTKSLSGLGTINRADPLATQIYTGPSDDRTNLITQELRVSSPASDHIEYTAGLFFSNQRTVQQPARFRITVALPFGIFTAVDSPGSLSYVTDESMAAFGQATIHLSHAFSILAGGRYTAAKLSLDNTPVGAGVIRSRLNTEKFSYKFGAQYQLNQATMGYAFVARGFKGGQIALPTGLAPILLQPEIPTSYEAGVKTTLFRSWVLDLSAFYSKIENFQSQNCVVARSSGQLVCLQNNIDGVKSRGAEINLFGQVTRNLSVNTGFIYAKTTYPNGFKGSDTSDLTGKQLAFSPRYKFTFSGEYTQPLTDRVSAFFAGDAVWKSRVSYEQTSNPETQFKQHWLVGGRIGVRSSDERYSVGVFARNLFNQHEPSLFLASGQSVLALYGPQSFRQVGLQLDAKF
jgi:iron complex outermembrane receptor protein